MCIIYKKKYREAYKVWDKHYNIFPMCGCLCYRVERLLYIRTYGHGCGLCSP